MKVYTLIAVLFAITICVSAQSHNITWGKYDPLAVHLKRVVVFKKSGFLQKKEDDFNFTLKDLPYIRQITQVVVTDQYTNGKGGFATLTSGGPGFNNVFIHLKSQRGHGFNFIIDIYGR